MRLKRIAFKAFIILLVAVSTPLLHQTVSFSKTQVLSLSSNARSSEADQLLQQGIEQFQSGQFEAAKQSNQQALTIYQDVGDSLRDNSPNVANPSLTATLTRKSWVQSLNNLGLFLYKEGQLKEAERTLRNGIQVWESLGARLDSSDADKMSILETQATTYRLLQKVLIAQNKIDTALEIAERSRTLAFMELLAARSNEAPTVASMIPPPTIKQIQQIAKTQNATLVEYSLIYDHLDELGQPQIQESELFIWVIQPTGEVTFRKSDLKPLWQGQTTTLAAFVNTVRQFLAEGEGSVGNYQRKKVRPFEQLYQVLIEPIADKLPTNPEARVIFIPQKSLFMIPFAPLQDAFGKYLIEQHTILTAPAIMLLSLTHQHRQHIPKSVKEWLVVGDPEPMPLNFRPLPAAKQEALAIASLMNTQAITGKVATKAEILQRMPSSRVIHLATHAILDERQGLDSAIALSAASTDNGWLTASEILDLKLSAELVVLSACNTGRGSITGDGFIGLSSSVILSGASSAIVTLWSIPDSPTAFLMKTFYQQLQQNPDKAQALRQAMLTTMKKRPALRDWAAFTLIGEAE
jgi:CHAT domain-containing protein